MDIYDPLSKALGLTPMHSTYDISSYSSEDIKTINSETARKLQLLRSDAGEHQWSGDGSFQRKIQLERVLKNTHPFQGNHEYWKMGAASINHPSKTKSVCPHCGKIGQTSNMKRYHFNNCSRIS